MSRIALLIVAVLVHVGLLVIFSISRTAHRKTERDEETLTVVLLADTLATKEPNRPVESTRKRYKSAKRKVPPDAAITAPSEVEAPPPPAIDWAEEAKLAASRQIDSLERSRNRGAGRVAPGVKLEPRPEPKPEFGWSHAQTHRIERLPEGGTLIWINERCALVVNGGLLPICKLGKIQARGDLFEHMRDAPEADDVQRPP